MKWYLRACPVCGGDLHDDIEDRGWVVCFMCARSFRVSEVHAIEGEGRQGTAEPLRLGKVA